MLTYKTYRFNKTYYFCLVILNIVIVNMGDNMNFDYTAIGKKIKKIREQQNITQEQLAELLGVSSAYISKIERGKTTLSLGTLSNLCTCLEVSLIVVLTGTLPSSQDYLRNDVIELLKDCSPQKVQLITEIIRNIKEYNE